MANETLARRYALAIFELAQERAAIDAVANDLRMLADGIYDDAATKEFFLSPVVGRAEKEAVITAAFGGKMNEITLHSVLLLVRKRREALLQEIARQYASLEVRARGAEPLTITSAKPLGEDELNALVARLEALYAKKFDVTQRVDSNLIGGVRVTMGDRRIDGSISGRLEELTRSLFAGAGN
ncbi:MAG: ATP synthase F1 subunit delta [Candidatus Eremiobacteraeota bacterium]|nr:ATP synthase F1 subunit delta [Candidatus Eremiobacteraeota bacterium]